MIVSMKLLAAESNVVFSGVFNAIPSKYLFTKMFRLLERWRLCVMAVLVN